MDREDINLNNVFPALFLNALLNTRSSGSFMFFIAYSPGRGPL